ncbi:MAG: MFS transporter, partial [Myxococcota bacterium]
LADYGWANGTLGLGASIGATMVGGALIARDGLARWVWPFVVAQNLPNLLYAAAAAGSLPATLPALYTIITVERFGEGLGTAVFMVFIMRCCDPEHRASHMALLTAFMGIGFTIAGLVSGELAEGLGFTAYFAVSALATVPAMLLISALPHLGGRRSV